MSTELTLTALEKAVLAKIIETSPDQRDLLANQLERGRIVSRKLTGKGFLLKFEVEACELFPLDFELGDVSAELEGLEHGAGFILFVRNGKISWLEGFAYGEPWPTHESGFRTLFAPPQRAKPH
jgi:hypothetical protein